jgi:alpha-beta hydrolase superfamily lysophospholipase
LLIFYASLDQIALLFKSVCALPVLCRNILLLCTINGYCMQFIFLRILFSLHYAMERTSEKDLQREMIVGAAGYRLSVWEQSATTTPWAMLCLVHGHGEHSGRYYAMAADLAHKGILVMGYDHWGHGLSEGRKGGPARAGIMLEDLGYFLMHARSVHNDLPLFLFGHSMGGNLVANYLIADKSREISGAIISSAWFELALPVPALKRIVGRWAGRYLPGLHASTSIEPELLTRDPERAQQMRNDPLSRHTIAAGLYSDLVASGARAVVDAHRIDVPLLVTHGTDDAVTSFEASEQFAQKAGEKAIFYPWEGQLHEPHQDVVRELAYTLYADWIGKHLPGAAAT